MASKLQRMEKELRELAGFAEHRADGDEPPGRGSEANPYLIPWPSRERGGGADE